MTAIAFVLYLSAGVACCWSILSAVNSGSPSQPAAAGNPLGGREWVANDGSRMKLAKDGSFVWYQDPNVTDDNYFAGSYAVYLGQDAFDYVTTDLSEYGITPQDLNGLFERNDNMKLDNFCCLVLNNDTAVMGGKTQNMDPWVSPCYGFYYAEKDYLDVANMVSGKYWGFTAQA